MRGHRPTCPPLGRRRHRLARQPTRCRLRLDHGCLASSSVGGRGDGTNPNVVLPPRGEDVIDSTAGGGLTAAIVAVARRRKEYHVVAAVEGHELKTPETENRPGLERLLETTHLKLDGKLFVNAQQAPTWRANCRRFNPGGVPGPTSKLSPRVPAQMGRRETEHEGRKKETGKRGNPRPSCCPAPRSGALAVGGYKRPRGRERETLRVGPFSRATNPLVREPWTFLL
jgi:hypothetical protein